MAIRYRVECARVGLEHAPGFVGDFDSIQAAHEAARAIKAVRPSDRVTVRKGADIPWDEQPAESRHPHGHHFLADDAEAEVVD